MLTATEKQVLEKAYGFRPISDEATTTNGMIRTWFQELAASVMRICPDNRARSLALTNLQQAKMWAVQSVCDDPMSEA